MQIPDSDTRAQDQDLDAHLPPCVLVFNANDPSGAGGLSADITAMASMGAHALPVLTGTYARDTATTFDHYPLDEEAVAEQARALLEDVQVQTIKVGFAGTPENLSAIAEIANDYAETPLIAYMPNLSWWNEVQIDLYQDAFAELLLPQTTILVGNHSTLWRWLLPEWDGDKPPSARDIARAAGEHGAAYALVTGIPVIDPSNPSEQQIDNVLSSPESVLGSLRFERFEAAFTGAGDTLSAALTALLASGNDLDEAFTEALAYLDQALDAGFRPGMGLVIPERMFWAQGDAEAGAADDEDATDEHHDPLDLPPHGTRH
jgi:hydroxymethylpyrimidine/phosphomethylpyrimidine kinase